MQDPFPRTQAAQRESEADWIGIYAGEQLELQLRAAQLAGTLSAEAEQLLRCCLSGVEEAIEACCPVALTAGRCGLTTGYGFPRTAGYPVLVAALQLPGAGQEVPQLTIVQGVLDRFSNRSCVRGAGERRRLLSAAHAGQWPALGRELRAYIGREGGISIATLFDDPHVRHLQSVLLVLTAGDAEASCCAYGVVSLPAIDVPAEALRVG
jgi:hypothetical protein